MSSFLALFAVLMSVLNWLLFLFLTLKEDIPELKKIINALLNPPVPPVVAPGMGAVVHHSGIDPNKLAAATGSLAGAFKKAGPAPTAAAMAVLFFLLALVAAGLGEIRGPR